MSTRQGPSLGEIAIEWGKIGCLGFGGPPAHIRMLRQLCVADRNWVSESEFEDAVAAVNLLPGPASTQLSIYLAWKQRGRLGALIGGLAFIVPGLLVILVLAHFFLASHAPMWIVGAGLGAGAAIPAVALTAGWSLLPTSRKRSDNKIRWTLYVVTGVFALATLGSWIVVALIACGFIEMFLRHRGSSHGALSIALIPKSLLVGSSIASSIAWVAFKVGALSYGGGFVIIPLMQFDAVTKYHWLTETQFLTAVALGQVTPGPVVQTVSVIGFAAAGLAGALLAALVAFAPSFIFVFVGASRFEELLQNVRVRAFIDGASPVAIGSILGSAFLLGRGLNEHWQFGVLAIALGALTVGKRGTVPVLLCAGLVGAIVTTILN